VHEVVPQQHLQITTQPEPPQRGGEGVAALLLRQRGFAAAAAAALVVVFVPAVSLFPVDVLADWDPGRSIEKVREREEERKRER